MLAAFALAGCLQDIPPGPDLGGCADTPSGPYAYGEVGIGSCLAGPTDLRFFEQDGGQFLAVSNADPFRNFSSGSVLVIDWDDLDARLLDPEVPDRLFLDELVAYALPIFDDDDGDGEGENAYLGEFGYLPEAQAAIVPGRMTEDGVVRSGIDDAWIVDLSAMEDEGGGITLLGDVELEDDPYLVQVEPETDRVYVANLTDHSISVLTTAVEADSPLPVAEIDVAPEAEITEATFDDVDLSDSFAEIVTSAIEDVTEVIPDTWTLTYVDGTVRLYVPSDAGAGVTGVVRHSSTGGDFLESPFGFEIGLSGVVDPFYQVDNQGVPYMYYARDVGENDWVLERAIGDYVAGNWSPSNTLLGDALRGGPSVAPLLSSTGLYYDRRPSAGDDAWIALATSFDGASYSEVGTILEPPVGVSYEDPFVALDPRAGRYRMWLSVREGASWSIGMTESIDGVEWPEPEIVVSLGADPVAAPAVAQLDGRYEMFVAVSDGLFWDIARCTSIDGATWSVPEVVIEGDQPITVDPPRSAIQIDTVGAWRIEGIEQGPNNALLPAGVGEAIEIVDANVQTRRMGFLLALSHGHEVSNEVVPDGQAAIALTPTSVAAVGGGEPLLYATVEGGSGARGMVALSEVPGALDSEGRWELAVGPLTFEDQLGVDSGRDVFAPVVAIDDEGAVMFYATTTNSGVNIRRATSTDGLTWTTLAGTDLLPPVPGSTGWDSVAQVPHSIEVTATGVRLWYTADDGAQFRIGSASASSLRTAFTRDAGSDLFPWRLDAGVAGGFDDSGVKDPLVVSIDGVPHLYYSGFDGSTWRIGHGTFGEDGLIRVRTDLSGLVPFPAMSEAERTFSAFGVESPVLYASEPDLLTLLYAGTDGLALRLGRAIVDPARPDEMFADPRRPTPGDTLTFRSSRGGPGAQVIELEQLTGVFGTTGEGLTSLELDAGLGFLYATSKKDDQVYVVDVRDDSTGGFVDDNHLELEDVIRIDTGSAEAGFRGCLLAPDTHILYLTMRLPDGIVLLDTSRLVDDALTESLIELAVATLPLPTLSEDEGADTLASIGGEGMALAGDLLLVTHFRGNGMSVFDRTLGAWGEEIAWIPDIGENPHVVRVSPDGRWAVVANYVGDVVEDTTAGTLAIVDLDPASERYLEVVAWLANK